MHDEMVIPVHFPLQCIQSPRVTFKPYFLQDSTVLSNTVEYELYTCNPQIPLQFFKNSQ